MQVLYERSPSVLDNTLNNKRETVLSKLFQGRLPQNVIEPTEKTRPPAVFQINHIGPFYFTFWTPDKFVKWVIALQDQNKWSSVAKMS